MTRGAQPSATIYRIFDRGSSTNHPIGMETGRASSANPPLGRELVELARSNILYMIALGWAPRVTWARLNVCKFDTIRTYIIFEILINYIHKLKGITLFTRTIMIL